MPRPAAHRSGSNHAAASSALYSLPPAAQAAASAAATAYSATSSMAHTHHPSSTGASRSISTAPSHGGSSISAVTGSNRRKQNANHGQNLNHLLSFTLPPRVPPPPPAYAQRSSRRAGGGSGSSWQAYDKERYLNAQYRFLVKPTEDYTAHFADPDIYLPWSHILQVLIPTSSALSGATTGLLPAQAQDSDSQDQHGAAACPICLSPPSAPRITRCGHVYCYPCILHYLATSADASPATAPSTGAGYGAGSYNSASTSGTSTPSRPVSIPGAARMPSLSTHGASAGGASTPTQHAQSQPSSQATVDALLPRLQKFSRCPICHDPVYARDLKAVKWWDARGAERKFSDDLHASSSSSSTRSAAKDEHLTLRLMERPHFTTLALPQSSTWPPQAVPASQVTSSTSNGSRHPSFLDPETKRALEISSSPVLLPVDSPSLQANEASGVSATGGPIPTNAAPWHFLPDVMTFSKFMLTTPAHLLASLAEDLSELAVERALLDGSQPGSGGTVDELGLVFVAMAERKVNEQMEKVRSELDTQWVRRRINVARAELAEHEERVRAQEEKERVRALKMRNGRQRKGAANAASQSTSAHDGARGASIEPLGDAAPKAEGVDVVDPAIGSFLATKKLDAFSLPPATSTASAETEVDHSTTTRTLGRNQRTRRNLNPPAPNSSSSLFYQAASGQNIFLHPLDIKVLRAQYDSYAHFPRALRVKVGGADESTVNADLRRRCKYLNHLPMSADVVFIEIDWEGMVAEAEAEARAKADEDVIAALQAEAGPIEEQDLEKTVSSLPPKPVVKAEVAPTVKTPATTTSSGLPIIQRATLKSYEQALRQRNQRRTDKTRKEDRAKLRAEEADRVASAAALAGLNAAHHGVVNGGRATRGLDVSSTSGNSSRGGNRRSTRAGGGGYDSSSIGGGNTSQSDDQYGRSFNSASSDHGGFGEPASYGSGGNGSALHAHALATSPSFREAAMMGAERVYPIHPGHEAATEDFPDTLRQHRGGRPGGEEHLSSDDESHDQADECGDHTTDDKQSARPNLGSRKSTATTPGRGQSKTVWGTPAARPWASTSASTGAGAAAADDWSEMDDAWLELEEDYILGAGGHGQRKTSGTTSLLNKESRGLNSQATGAGGNGRLQATPTSTARPSVSTRLSTSSLSAASAARAAVELDDDAKAAAEGQETPGRKQKAKKKKLILTAGGRGR
ncbi:hypothetical protein V8E36_000905 [Tilletia maclaganii]